MMDAVIFPPDMTIADVQGRYTREDLIQITHQVIDAMLGMVRDVPDSFVTFLPEDPLADDPWCSSPENRYLAWTLGHVIVHTTASAEERAVHGSMLARGAEVKGRSRYETPWQTVTTTQQIVQRLEESRRMRLAFLDTWPDAPHLDNLYQQRQYVERYGAMNAVGMTLFGIKHELEHLGQIEEIVRQAKEALGCLEC